MILVDANIPMYLVGAEHPNKHAAASAVESAVAAGERLVTDVEVFQEILYRYGALRRPEAVRPAFDLLLALVDETLPLDLADIQLARSIVEDGYPISARDAVHVAVMRRHQVGTIMSFHQGFDRYPGLTRIC